jgi:hypothetical protein
VAAVAGALLLCGKTKGCSVSIAEYLAVLIAAVILIRRRRKKDPENEEMADLPTARSEPLYAPLPEFAMNNGVYAPIGIYIYELTETFLVGRQDSWEIPFG